MDVAGSIYPMKAINIIKINIKNPTSHTSKLESNNKHKKIALNKCKKILK